jgi:hypothetical protein
MRYPRRSLMIALGVLPPALAALWFAGPRAWFLLALGLITYPWLYFWVVEPKPTSVGIVMRWVILMLVVLGLVALLIPAVQ